MSTTQFRAAATRHPRLYTALHATVARVATSIARNYRRDAEAAADEVAELKDQVAELKDQIGDLEAHIETLDAERKRANAERDHWFAVALQHAENAGGERQ